MTAAELLSTRNDVIISLRDVDDRLGELFATEHSNRVYAECLELLDLRFVLAEELVRLGGEPGPEPSMKFSGKKVSG